MTVHETYPHFSPPPKKGRLTAAEKKRRAMRGNYSFRHPINHAHWDMMSHINILGAALYTFGVDPDAILEDLEHSGDWPPLEELEPYLGERLRIIASAVISGKIKTIAEPPTSEIQLTNLLLISLASFKEWYKESNLSSELTLAAPEFPEDQPNHIRPVRNKSKNKSNTLTSDFDPLFLSAISRIFILDRDTLINKTRWKAFAKDANRNGLVEARIVKGKGKRESTFDPIKIGDWLVTKAYKTMAEVNKSLASNLPNRSAHKKEYYLQ